VCFVCLFSPLLFECVISVVMVITIRISADVSLFFSISLLFVDADDTQTYTETDAHTRTRHSDHPLLTDDLLRRACVFDSPPNV
jgi:glucan phosphoethanolaminetransferase (alkaline phosphatase superfamily)